MPSKNFRAFATTKGNDGPRVPIHAERIVVVLGEDAEGRPLEISILLEDGGNSPPELWVAAIVEPTPPDLVGSYVPNLVMEKAPTYNTGHLSVWHDPSKHNDNGDA